MASSRQLVRQNMVGTLHRLYQPYLFFPKKHFSPTKLANTAPPWQYRLASTGTSTSTSTSTGSIAGSITTASIRQSPENEYVLQTLPLPVLLRSLLVLSITSLPPTILSTLIRTARKRANWVESNRFLHWVVRRTFYDTFCVGRDEEEMRGSMRRLREMGVKGIILSFAREEVTGPGSVSGLGLRSALGSGTRDEGMRERSEMDLTNRVGEDIQLQEWEKWNIETVRRLQKGDFLALKFTGAGRKTILFMEELNRLLASGRMQGEEENWLGGDGDRTVLGRQSGVLKDSMGRICSAAQERGVRVLIDAEEGRVQGAIDSLALNFMTEFNSNGTAIVFNTYQMYLKSTPSRVHQHLHLSASRNFVLGIKLVRGAYMHTEPDRPNIIWPTKAETDRAYDAMVSFLLRGGEGDALLLDRGNSDLPSQAPMKGREKEGEKPWKAALVLASHNPQSVAKALALYSGFGGSGENLQTAGQRRQGRLQSLEFAQLMGMADELSMKLVRTISGLHPSSSSLPSGIAASTTAINDENYDDEVSERNKHHDMISHVGVYKATVWGSVGECLLYMLRRAEENKDATARSRDSKIAILREIWRRIGLY